MRGRVPLGHSLLLRGVSGVGGRFLIVRICRSGVAHSCTSVWGVTWILVLVWAVRVFGVRGTTLDPYVLLLWIGE